MSVDSLRVLVILSLLFACKQHSSGPDTIPPSGEALKINSGAIITDDRSVTLELTVDSADEMYITNSSDCVSGGDWIPFQSSIAWNLGQPNGPGSVYAKFRDKAGNESSCATASIDLMALSVARTSIKSASVGTKLLFAGGSSSHGEGYSYSLVDIYDSSNQKWSQVQLSSGRAGLAVARVGSLVLFAGGHLAKWVGPGGTHLSVSMFNNVDIYDSTTDSLATTHFAEALSERGATVVGTKVYFAGGGTIGGAYDRIPTAKVDIYDSSTKSWSTSALSVARSAVSGFTVGNKAIFAGGIIGFQPRLVVDIYDTTSDTWTATNLPQNGRLGAVIGDKLYYTVGDKTSSSVSQIQVYDVTENSWSLVTLPRTVSNCSHLLATSSKIILVSASEMSIYDPTDNSLTTKPLGLIRNTSDIGGAFANDTTVYLVGGLEALTNGTYKTLDQFRTIDL